METMKKNQFPKTNTQIQSIHKIYIKYESYQYKCAKLICYQNQ